MRKNPPKPPAPAPAPPKVAPIRVPPISVKVTIPVTETRCGQDTTSCVDEVTSLNVQGSRYALAEKLRALADIIAGTQGDEVTGSVIVVGLRKRTP